MVVSIQTESSFLSAWKGGAHRTRVCSNIHVQYVTHTYWRTEEERADRGGAKSAVACTYNDDATMMMHSLTFQAHDGQVCMHVVV